MFVSDLIKKASLIGIGIDDPKGSEQEIYLKYFNIAYKDLFNLVFRESPSRFLTEMSLKNGDDVFSVLSIERVKRKNDNTLLKEVDIFSSFEASPHDLRNCYQIMFGVGGQATIKTFPEEDRIDLGILYYRQPETFDLEDDLELSTQYFALMETPLIDGIIYYSLMGESGFSSNTDINIFLKKWESSKSTLISQMQQYNGRDNLAYSTYSSV